ncbi:MAG: N-acetylmuramoyl-L-alanine amidase [Chthoniobacteraceae bacterium]
MYRSLLRLLLLACFVPLTSCTTPTASSGKRVSTTRDEWGHRPGARGFSTVILDAGHGGKDSGATSSITGQREKDLTLDMVQRVRSALGSNVRTVVTRSSDTFVELDDRVSIANRSNDAVLVSIHFNFGASNLAGPEVYYWRVDSYTLGRRIFSALSQATQEKHANRGLVRRRLRLTRNPQLASVLVECGYLTHGSEARLIAKPEYRTRLAKAIARAILDQRSQGDGNLGPLPQPLNEPMSRATDRRE